MNICMIGFGHMAKAIATRLLHDQRILVHVAAPSLPIGVTADGIHTHHDNLAVLAQADVIILAVKPVQMTGVLLQIHAAIPKRAIIISIAAGLSLDWLTKRTPVDSIIIRAMPNIAAAVGEAATPLFANAFATNAHKAVAEQIFKAVGITTWAQQESDIDTFTALSGSGPAYVFLFMEALIDAATTLGLNTEIAKTFALQTVKGAVSLATVQEDVSLAHLRHSVTSPGGTTAAALQVLTQLGFDEIIHTAMQAACKRARELEQH